MPHRIVPNNLTKHVKQTINHFSVRVAVFTSSSTKTTTSHIHNKYIKCTFITTIINNNNISILFYLYEIREVNHDADHESRNERIVIFSCLWFVHQEWSVVQWENGKIGLRLKFYHREHKQHVKTAWQIKVIIWKVHCKHLIQWKT